MNDSDNIKALIPVVCPHCSKTSVVEFLITANLLDPVKADEILKSLEPVVVEPIAEPIKAEEIKETPNESEEE